MLGETVVIPLLQAALKGCLPGKVRSKIRLGAHKAAKGRAAPSTSNART